MLHTYFRILKQISNVPPVKKPFTDVKWRLIDACRLSIWLNERSWKEAKKRARGFVTIRVSVPHSFHQFYKLPKNNGILKCGVHIFTDRIAHKSSWKIVFLMADWSKTAIGSIAKWMKLLGTSKYLMKLSRSMVWETNLWCTLLKRDVCGPGLTASTVEITGRADETNTYKCIESSSSWGIFAKHYWKIARKPKPVEDLLSCTFAEQFNGAHHRDPYLCKGVCAHVCICMRVCVPASVHAAVFACIRVHVRVHACTCMCMHARTCAYLFVCICLCNDFNSELLKLERAMRWA